MITFSVPASTTNLGHGFDCLGMALAASNRIGVEAISGPVDEAPAAGDAGLVVMAGVVRDACAAQWGVALPRIRVRVIGDVPIARGMGSSSTILLGCAAACQRLAGRRFDKQELMPIAAKLEGHPDNVAAACLGGFTTVAEVAGGLRCQRFDVPGELVAVVAIPPFEVKTSAARAILPASFTRAEGVMALQRSALITAAIALGKPQDLRGLFDDAWHEHYRSGLNPGLVEARAAGAAAGAIGTILSGSGSTVLSFVLKAQAEAVRVAISESYRRRTVAVEMRILPFDNRGLCEV
jgi:homoserine kinase